jgi:hypothetical protein
VDSLPFLQWFATTGWTERVALLAPAGLLQHRVHQREVHDLRQLPQMTRREHTPGSIVDVMTDFPCNGTPDPDRLSSPIVDLSGGPVALFSRT